MNRFGRFAQEMWQSLAPSAYEQIENPNQHFSMLGEQAQGAWIHLMDQMEERSYVPGEESLEKIGRLNNIRRRAEEIIRADWLMPPPELIEPDPDDDGDQMHPWDAYRTVSDWLANPETLEEPLEDAMARLGITLEMLDWTQEDLDRNKAEWAEFHVRMDRWEARSTVTDMAAHPEVSDQEPLEDAMARLGITLEMLDWTQEDLDRVKADAPGWTWEERKRIKATYEF